MANDEHAHDDAPAASAKHPDADTVTALSEGADRGNSVSARAVTINRPREEVFAYFRNFANLPTFMDNVVRVEESGEHSHWVVKAPGGKTVEWEATLTEDRAPELIAWTSDEGADVANAGRVEFSDAGERGTVVTATLVYDPPAGVVGKVVAKLFQREPAIQARRDLRRFKQLMETGEIATAAPNRAAHEKEDA